MTNTNKTKAELVSLVQEFVKVHAPTKWRVNEYPSRNPGAVETVNGNGATIATFSWTRENQVRIASTYKSEKALLQAAGVKNTRISVECQPGFLAQGYQKFVAKFLEIDAKVQPLREEKKAANERAEKREKEILHEIGAYGHFRPQFFRQHGSGMVNHIDTDLDLIDVKLSNVPLAKLQAILQILGEEVAPAVSDDYVRNEVTGHTPEEWNALSEEEKAGFRSKGVIDCYGPKN